MEQEEGEGVGEGAADVKMEQQNVWLYNWHV